MISTPDVYPQIVCIHSDDPARCWRCADVRADLAVLAVLQETAGPLALEEIAALCADPDPWWRGQTCGALVRLRNAGRVDLAGGRFRVVVDEGGKGGGIYSGKNSKIEIDAHTRQDQGPEMGPAGCSRSRRRCENS